MEVSNLSSFIIRYAKPDEWEQIYKLLDRYADEVGYVPPPSIRGSIRKHEIIVVEADGKVVGCTNFHKRKDGLTTIYEIVVDKDYRGRGYGRAMIEWLRTHGYRSIILKCPIDNASNKFYEHIGFKLVKRERGQKRDLNVWRLF